MDTVMNDFFIVAPKKKSKRNKDLSVASGGFGNAQLSCERARL